MSDTPQDAVETGFTETATLSDSVGTLRVHRPLPADHPTYALLGRVTAEWALLEHTLDQIIWDISGISSPLASCITGQFMSYSQRLDAISALAAGKGLPAKLLRPIEQLKNELHGLAKERNRYVHDAWYIDVDQGDLAQFRSIRPKQAVFGMQDITAESVEVLIDKIKQRVARAFTIWHDLCVQLNSPPKLIK